MWISDRWTDYELLDATDGMRLERWGGYVLARPDPQVIWRFEKKHPRWRSPDAVYARSDKGGGSWSKHNLPASWRIRYGDLTFAVRPMNFKHTGLFPEQAANWDEAARLIARRSNPVRLLNLFAYTGGATVASAAAGARVTHVDAAKGMVQWARENAALSGVQARFFVDDCVKLVEREIRRGSEYEAIILDPPSYGRGPSGEVWKLEDNLFDLLTLSTRLLSDDAQFMFINTYTTGLAPSTLRYLLGSLLVPRFGGEASAEELGLPVTQSGLILPCGATGRWIRY